MGAAPLGGLRRPSPTLPRPGELQVLRTAAAAGKGVRAEDVFKALKTLEKKRLKARTPAAAAPASAWPLGQGWPPARRSFWRRAAQDCLTGGSPGSWRPAAIPAMHAAGGRAPAGPLRQPAAGPPCRAGRTGTTASAARGAPAGGGASSTPSVGLSFTPIPLPVLRTREYRAREGAAAGFKSDWHGTGKAC